MALLREKKRASTRESLLEAARKLFVVHGYDFTTVDQIAENEMVSKPTFYTHFRSKEEILIALHELGIEEALGTLLGQIDEAPSAVQLLRDMNERMAEWYENNRELACLFCSKRSIVDTSCATSSACDNLRRIILRAQDLGEFSRDLSADRIADLMILLYFNEKQSWIKNNFTTSLREGIRSCTHALFYGVVKR